MSVWLVCLLLLVAPSACSSTALSLSSGAQCSLNRTSPLSALRVISSDDALRLVDTSHVAVFLYTANRDVFAKRMETIMRAIAAAYPDVSVYHVRRSGGDFAESDKFALRFTLRAAPAVVITHDGKLAADAITGATVAPRKFADIAKVLTAITHAQPRHIDAESALADIARSNTGNVDAAHARADTLVVCTLIATVSAIAIIRHNRE